MVKPFPTDGSKIECGREGLIDVLSEDKYESSLTIDLINISLRIKFPELIRHFFDDFYLLIITLFDSSNMNKCARSVLSTGKS